MAYLDTPELKAAFAAFYVSSKQESQQQKAWEAAKRLYPLERDQGEVNRIVWSWPADPLVIAEIAKIEAIKPNVEGVPSKDEVIKDLWALAKNERTLPKDRAALGRLVAEMLGYIVKTPEDTESKVMPREPVYKIVDS